MDENRHSSSVAFLAVALGLASLNVRRFWKRYPYTDMMERLAKFSFFGPGGDFGIQGLVLRSLGSLGFSLGGERITRVTSCLGRWISGCCSADDVRSISRAV